MGAMVSNIHGSWIRTCQKVAPRAAPCKGHKNEPTQKTVSRGGPVSLKDGLNYCSKNGVDPCQTVAPG